MKLVVMTLATACLATACTDAGSGTDTTDADVVRVPGTSNRTLGGLAFTMAGPTAPGSAELANAYYSDYDHLPFDTDGYADGSMTIVIDGQTFDSPAVDSVFVPLVGDSGEEIIGISGVQVVRDYYNYRQTMNHLVVILPEADIEAGATIELDGVKRFAVFASGDPYLSPSVYGAAVRGTVTFDLNTGTDSDRLIGATIDGDFGAIEIVESADEPRS